MAKSSIKGLFGRFTVVLLAPIAIAGIFAYTGGWLTPHALTPARMIDTFENVDGPHAGFRRNHAKGVCVSGYFDSNGSGAAYSRALVFMKGRTPVIGRFALAGGQPFQADAPHTVRSMALLFKFSDGEQWRMGINNIPVFVVATPQAFYELMLAAAPDPATGKPNPDKMSNFLVRNPESAKALEIIRNSPVASGFDNSTYNSLDAFYFVDAQGKATAVRWSMVPVQRFEPISISPPAQSDSNYLFDALIAAVHGHALQWHLVITIGQQQDPTNDATLAWPPDRQRIDVGTLTIDHIESEDTSPARDINFDPLVLPDGIAPSDDPLLSARSAAYSESFTRREGEKKDPSAVSTAEVSK